MKYRIALTTILLIGFALGFGSCAKDVLGPNELGGDSNLDYTKVGQQFGAVVYVPDTYIPGLSNLKDTVLVTKNNNGVVTFHANLGFDSAFVKGLDSALGTSQLSPQLRNTAIDTYKARFGVTLDTSNPKNMHASFDLKMKITADGIQEFVNSRGDESKPYTIVKYSAAVGDKYEFTNADNVHVTRTVTYHSTTDDYPIGFWNIKVMKVEETKEDLFVDKITYITNHKYGLVGVVIKTKTGKNFELSIYPPTL